MKTKCKMKTSKLLRHTAIILLGIFALTSLSCERDTFYVPEYEPGEPVDVLLEFELPEKDEITVTRTMTSKAEHNVNDFYLLIFDEGGKRIFGKYYGTAEMQTKVEYDGGKWTSVRKYKDNPDEANSTHGSVIASAISSKCYIFGFANIGASQHKETFQRGDVLPPELQGIEGAAVVKNLLEGMTSMRNKLDNVDQISDLYNVMVEALPNADDNIIDRTEGNLMYSGYWRNYNVEPSDLDYNQNTAGLVDIGALLRDWKVNPTHYPADFYNETTKKINLTKIGMIYLRCLTAHVSFHITFDKEMFSSFEPESFQVINVPKRVYLMDHGTGEGAPVKTAEIEFKNSKVMKNRMIHDDAKFTFDFWMYENHKNPRTASTEETSDLYKSISYVKANSGYVDEDNLADDVYKTQYLYDDQGDKITNSNPDVGIINYYKVYFGERLMQWDDEGDGTGNPLPKLITNYGYGSSGTVAESYGYKTGDDVNTLATNQFLYDKREYQVKRRTTKTALWNREKDIYPNAAYDAFPSDVCPPAEKTRLQTIQNSSRKFIYAPDKSTYVLIKGRLRFNTKNTNGTTKPVTLKNFASGRTIVDDKEYLTSNTQDYRDGYVDVTYTVHLGDFSEGKYDNFDIIRNTEYEYYMNIKGVNSIYTTVMTNIANKSPGANPILFKKMPGADGMMSLADGKVYNADAHFCQFNMKLTKDALNQFYFEMHTPFRSNNITSKDVTTDLANGYKSTNDGSAGYNDYMAKYGDNPDFYWFKFAPCYDQTGMFDDPSTFETNEETYARQRATVRYNKLNYQPTNPATAPTIWNLFTFTETMAALVGLQEEHGLDEDKVEDNDDIEERIGDLLDPNLVFECKVGDVHYTKATGTALPFLLDKTAYPVHASYYTAKKTAQDNGTISKYQSCRPFTSQESLNYGAEYSGGGMIVEDYILYFLDHNTHLSTAQREQLEATDGIRRMFYTVYLDEYYYHKAPPGAGWSKLPLWQNFVNQPARYVNFGYGNVLTTNGYSMSDDNQSGVMVTSISVSQRSIQTFYSTDLTPAEISSYIGLGGKYVAIGLEHVNETHDPRWVDTVHDIPHSTLDSYNGWTNTENYVNGDGYWQEYVDDITYDRFNGMQTNVAMRLNPGFTAAVVDSTERATTHGEGNADENPYKAGAIRMCMNRNRDENGDGKIDQYELKWFLPTSRQLELATMGHYSLESPLLDYNKFVQNDGQHRLPKDQFRSSHLAEYHFMASDYTILLAEEYTNSPQYNLEQDYMTRPYDMRCMRNLGGETGIDPGDGHTTVNISSVSQSTMFQFDDDREGNTRVFSVNLFDGRSIRKEYYNAEELPKHYVYSRHNLPYRKFQVAKKLVKKIKDGAKDYEELFVEKLPCKSYTEDEQGQDRDKGSWRVPNAAELALMVLELRNYNNSLGNNKVDERTTPWFFSNNADNDRPYSSSSLNFSGYWGRVVGVLYTGSGEGWGLHSANPPKWDNYKNGAFVDLSNNHSQVENQTAVRCVRDVR